VTIDALLAEIWGNEVRHPLDLRVCAFPQPVTDEVWDYAQALGGLLGGRVSRLDTSEGMEALVEKGECAECDLIIFEEPDHRLIHRLLSRLATDSTPALRRSRVPFAVLAARQPRWPLRSILLIICGQGPDDAAVDWVSRLARQSGSAVTVLTVVPPVPAMYSQRARMDQGLPALLSTDTALGRQMRRVAQHLVERRIEGTLRLRQGAPDWQIRCEIIKGNYDLIALATRPRQWWMRWLEGDLVCLLLRQADRPVLVAKPRTA
jgi:nucleotide-binding universal stress UspA family protein